jgi:hypothetical protein
VQGVLVANRRTLVERPQQLLPVVHELLERLDAHLKAEDYYSGELACRVGSYSPALSASHRLGHTCRAACSGLVTVVELVYMLETHQLWRASVSSLLACAGGPFEQNQFS